MKTIKRNTKVTVRHILGETAEALVTRLDEETYKFNCDAYVAGETCKGGFYHLRQARRVIPGKKLGNNVKFWPRMRRALHEAGVEPVNIPGGNVPIHYHDELVIPDFSTAGSHYFIVKYKDIGKYLDTLPLDAAGKAKAEDCARKKAEAEAEAYRQAHDPKCIASHIGEVIWGAGGYSLGGEFIKVILLAPDNSQFSVMYPQMETDLLWHLEEDVVQILCKAPETGVKFISGKVAYFLNPMNHYRIKKVSNNESGDEAAYLMPDPYMATVVKEHYRWMSIFDDSDNDGISPDLVASAKKVIVESYDLQDKLLKRLIFDRDTEEVKEEDL